MAYVTPGTVAAGDVATAAAWNVLVGNDIALESRFRVVQIVSGNLGNGSGTTNSTTTYIATGLSATITPKSVNNKILVLVNQGNRKSNANSQTECQTRLYRGASAVDTNQTMSTCYTNSAMELRIMNSMSYLDSPATTSATTYTMYLSASVGTASTDYFTAGQMVLIEIQP